jgi:predicted ATPase/DNA-binding SARP family transcriptional activator
VDFAILGPLEVRRDDGAPIAIGGAKTRGLLALFLLTPNEWVSTDRLIEDLWAGEPPRKSGPVLQVHIANLRKALEPSRRRGEPSRLATRPGGYLLALAPEELDSLRFESLANEGRDALARDDAPSAWDRLGSALALWRGPVLGDLADEPFVATSRSRFEEARVVAFEDHIDAGLQLGHHAELVARLEAAVAENPMRERLWAQLMLALYRSGRQAEALRAYGSARAALVDELGIDPGPELQALERAILEQDPALAPPARAAVAAELPPRRARTALPQPPNRLVGRDDDVAAAVDLLAEADVRMVTLTGAGGAGKTRLAEAIARAVEDRFTDGIVFVHLASVAGPDLVAPAIAQAIGIDELATQPVQETLRRALADLELLLVIDNFEHLLVSSGVLAELLAGAARLKMLVTSRSPLRLGAEYEFQVPPLTVPKLGGSATVEQLAACASIELFCERARAARSGFALTTENASTVAEICVRLDGLPLAIELAAARVRVLSPEALLNRLGHRLDLLTGGARDAPDRQRTLRATIEWSYDLLTDDERRVFAWLGVFGGWFGFADIEAVCTSPQLSDFAESAGLLEGVSSLVEKSLLQHDAHSLDGRFAMLETVREFACGALIAFGDEAEARALHRAWFLALARDAQASVNTAREHECFRALDAAADNLRLALVSAAETDPTGLAQLCSALAPWWLKPSDSGSGRSRFTEGSYWINLVLDRDDVELSADLFMHAGVLASRQDDFATAVPLIERAQRAFAEADDVIGSVDCLTYLGEIAVLQGRLDAALGYANEAHELATTAGDGATARYASYLLGWVAEERGDLGEARRRFEEDLEFARAHDVAAGVAYALVTLAELDILAAQLEAAERRVGEARAVQRDSGNAQFESYCHRIEGLVALGRGDGARAWKQYSAALDAAVDLGRMLEATWCLGGLASAAVLMEDHRLGTRLFAAAHRLRARALAAEPLIEQRMYEPHLITARATLGAEAFSAEWNTARVDNVEAACRLIADGAAARLG